MARSVLVDTGPIVAYLHRGDAWHAAATRFFKIWRGETLTTWPVITEAMYLSDSNAARFGLLQWIQRDLMVPPQDADDARVIERYLKKYADRKPDFADLSVLALAERTGIRDIATIDASDFQVYRLSNGRGLNNLLAA